MSPVLRSVLMLVQLIGLLFGLWLFTTALMLAAA